MAVKTDPPAEMATKFINRKFIPISDANSRKTKCWREKKIINCGGAGLFSDTR